MFEVISYKLISESVKIILVFFVFVFVFFLLMIGKHAASRFVREGTF